MSHSHVLSEIIRNLQLDDAPTGGALVVYQHGKCIFDTSVGQANKDIPWTSHTLSLNFSTGKGVLATLIHCIVSAGLLDVDTPIAYYWPEFTVNGKQDITVRHVMSHQSDLFAIDEIIDNIQMMCDWDEMVKRVTTMSPTPTKPKGELRYSTAYNALVYGWILGELIKRVTKLTLQQALDTYLAEPLGIAGEVFFGVPNNKLKQVAQPLRHFDVGDVNRSSDTNSIGNTDATSSNTKSSSTPKTKRRKPVMKADSERTLQVYNKLPSYALWLDRWQQDKSSDTNTLTTADINSLYFNPSLLNIANYKSALMPNAKQNFDYYDAHVLQSVIPAANCVASAQALAKIYAMLANKGTFSDYEFINPQTFEKLIKVHSEGMDAVMPATNPPSMKWRLGYHRVFAIGTNVDNAFGHIGYNGSMAWCDPSRNLSVAYVHNYDSIMLNDVRQFAITEAVLMNL